MSDRPASLLTNTQRDYLRGEEKENKSHERALRSRLRRRVRAGFQDLKLLLDAEANDRIDLTELLADGGRPDNIGETQSKDDNADADTPPWILAALLFMWTEENPRYTDAQEFIDAVNQPDSTPSSQTMMDRRTASFDAQVEKGVRAALELSNSSQAVTNTENTLSVSVGPPVEEMTEEEIADLPRHEVDILFQRGDIGDQLYAQIMKEKLSD